MRRSVELKIVKIMDIFIGDIFVGGIVGFTYEKAKIVDCINRGKYEGRGNYSGILGCNLGSGGDVIENCSDEYEVEWDNFLVYSCWTFRFFIKNYMFSEKR